MGLYVLCGCQSERNVWIQWQSAGGDARKGRVQYGVQPLCADAAAVAKRVGCEVPQGAEREEQEVRRYMSSWILLEHCRREQHAFERCFRSAWTYMDGDIAATLCGVLDPFVR